MGIYARQPRRLLGQIATDLMVVGWVVAWWLLGGFVRDSIASIAAPARETVAATQRMSTELRDAGTQASQLPGIGDQLRRPFDSAAQALSGLRDSAEQQVASIEQLATVVGWLVFVIPVAVVLARWLPGRVRFFLRARAAQRFLDSTADLDLFALRALATQPMQVLARISDDPVKAWRTGDSAVISQLAEVELRRSGLRLPAGSRTDGPTGPSAPAAGGLRADSGGQRMGS